MTTLTVTPCRSCGREKALPDAWWRIGIWRPKGSRNGNYKHEPVHR
jgi:hypothetical protein